MYESIYYGRCFQRGDNEMDSDQLAMSGTSWSGSKLFSKEAHNDDIVKPLTLATTAETQA